VETLHVQFGFDRADLTDGAQTALLQVTKELKENPLLSVDLEGYTDPTGPREYNIGLSQRRVESVRRFLAGNGADLSRIHSVGLGPLNGKEQAALQRRVTVRLMINPAD
jgi:outer membrane protein OmpA-like peptidoglycan-associated protein